MPVTLDTMDINVIRNAAKPVPIRHVISQQGSAIRVRMVILGCFVTVHAVIPATAINVAGTETACPDVHTITMAHGASLNALNTARPPQPAAAVTTKVTVCTDVSTVLQVSTVSRHALVAVMVAVIYTRERVMPVTLDTLDINVIRNVVKPVPIRNVTLQQGSAIRVRMVILGCFVTFHAVIPATAINVAGMETARPDVHTTTMVHSATSNVLNTARPPQSAAAVTTKDIACMDVLTDLQVTTVTQVREWGMLIVKTYNICVPVYLCLIVRANKMSCCAQFYICLILKISKIVMLMSRNEFIDV